jgi:hypothetical protein
LLLVFFRTRWWVEYRNLKPSESFWTKCRLARILLKILEFFTVQPPEFLCFSDFLGQCILRGVLRTHSTIEKPDEERNTQDFHLLSKQVTVRTAILSDQELGSMPIIIKNNDQKIIQLGSARWHWVCNRSDLFVYCRSWRKSTCLRRLRRSLWIVFVD